MANAVLFQSLFWWNVLLNLVVRKRPVIGRIASFNPCSGGMYF